MDTHEVAKLFPLMSAEEFEALKADMQEHGQREPIWTYRGKILDGRNRYQACEALGLTVQCREYEGNGSLTAFVLSMNLKRRHLTKNQAAMVAAEAEPLFAKEAKARQVEAGQRGKEGGRGNKKTLVQKMEQGFMEKKAAVQAGKTLNVNHQYVAQAKKLKAEHPELAEQVKQGTLTLQDAKKAVKQAEQVHKAECSPIPPDEQKLIDALKCGETVIVNIQAHAHVMKWACEHQKFIPVDRTTPWGNPFILDKDGTREEVVRNYGLHYLPHKPSLLKELHKLQGAALGCHCAPLLCHADELIKRIEKR